MKSNISKARYITCVAIMASVSTILMFLDFSIPLMPGFIKVDFSELPALIATFSLGPCAGVLVCLIKNLINMCTTTTAAVGEIVNFMLGVLFVVPAGLFYKYKRNRIGALIGALIGSLCMASFGILLNYYVTYPVYAKVMVPMPVIIKAYQAILPSVDNLWQALIYFNFPFTFFKGLANTLLCFAIYKPMSSIIKGYGFKKKKAVIATQPDTSTEQNESMLQQDADTNTVNEVVSLENKSQDDDKDSSTDILE